LTRCKTIKKKYIDIQKDLTYSPAVKNNILSNRSNKYGGEPANPC
jgi:hypothetical protein